MKKRHQTIILEFVERNGSYSVFLIACRKHQVARRRPHAVLDQSCHPREIIGKFVFVDDIYFYKNYININLMSPSDN